MDIDLKNLTKEELLELVESKGLIKEFAAEAKLLKISNDTEEAKTTTTRKTNEPVFELVMNDNNDIAIRKTSGRAWKMLVIMTSQGVGFIKDKNGTTKITEDSVSLVNGFLKGMKPMDIPGCWLNHLDQGIEYAYGLVNTLINEKLMECYKNGCGPAFRTDNRIRKNSHEQWVKSYEMHSTVMKKYKDVDRILHLVVANRDFINEIESRYGIDNLYVFLEEFNLSLIDLQTNNWRRNADFRYDSFDNSTCELRYGYHQQRVFPDCNMEFTAFKNYFLYGSVRMGYAKNIEKFMNEWKDAIRMQKQLYGKVKEKYPQYLQTTHAILSYKCVLFQEEISAKGFEKNSRIAKEFEAKIGDYVFIAPSVKQDFYDEAEMQQNCLASYVNKFANGECIIMFMRNKETPEQSLVTIEIVNGNLTQKFQAQNQPTTIEQNIVINEWMQTVVYKKIHEWVKNKTHKKAA